MNKLSKLSEAIIANYRTELEYLENEALPKVQDLIAHFSDNTLKSHKSDYRTNILEDFYSMEKRLHLMILEAKSVLGQVDMHLKARQVLKGEEYETWLHEQKEKELSEGITEAAE